MIVVNPNHLPRERHQVGSVLARRRHVPQLDVFFLRGTVRMQQSRHEGGEARSFARREDVLREGGEGLMGRSAGGGLGRRAESVSVGGGRPSASGILLVGLGMGGRATRADLRFLRSFGGSLLAVAVGGRASFGGGLFPKIVVIIGIIGIIIGRFFRRRRLGGLLVLLVVRGYVFIFVAVVVAIFGLALARRFPLLRTADL
mmetsp:Transcript_29353/g.61212  ORF Transcript_29353/g.61212 Transcript_29353/m.61212 type:complete len:201 (-) Transcript_29353:267-869(-)